MAAMDLFLSRGYGETSLAQVAQAAGVSRTTLFAYFPSKASLFLGPFDITGERMESELQARPEGESLAASLRAVCRTLFRSPEGEPGTMSERLRILDANVDILAELERHRREQRLILRAFVARRSAHGADELIPHVLVDTLLAACESAARHWATTETHSVPYSAHLDEALTPILRGFLGS